MNNDYNNQAPQYQAPMPPQPGKGSATGSLVCGIISLATWWLGWFAIIGLVLGIVAIILAVKAKKEGFVGGLATGGLVMGIIGTVVCGIGFLTCGVCAACVLAEAGASGLLS